MSTSNNTTEDVYPHDTASLSLPQGDESEQPQAAPSDSQNVFEQQRELERHIADLETQLAFWETQFAFWETQQSSPPESLYVMLNKNEKYRIYVGDDSAAASALIKDKFPIKHFSRITIESSAQEILKFEEEVQINASSIQSSLGGGATRLPRNHHESQKI